MTKGKFGDWYQDECIAGYIREDGTICVVFEDMSDADADRYFVEVQNGDGYYNEDGRFVRYNPER